MQIKSKLENNIFCGVLLKKGLHTYKNSDYTRMTFDKDFKRHILVRNIEIIGLKAETKAKEEKPDFTVMTYKELVAYVKEHKIKTKSMKLADILAALQ